MMAGPHISHLLFQTLIRERESGALSSASVRTRCYHCVYRGGRVPSTAFSRTDNCPILIKQCPLQNPEHPARGRPYADGREEATY